MVYHISSLCKYLCKTKPRFLSFIKRCEISPIVISPKKFRLDSDQNIVIISDKSESIDVSLKDFKTNHLIFNKKYDVLKGMSNIFIIIYINYKIL